MTLLFVNACPRGEASRTLHLARVFLAEVTRLAPELEIITHDLNVMGLPSIDAASLAIRESLCDRQDWSHPLTKHAVAFQQADAVVIAAPYWDLSFPSSLKVWVENMYIRNLTFHYENDRCIGHCCAVQGVYITTSGSPIGENDWGAGYMQAVLKALGIGDFRSIAAEGLDLVGNDLEAIMTAAEERVWEAAQALIKKLNAR